MGAMGATALTEQYVPPSILIIFLLYFPENIKHKPRKAEMIVLKNMINKDNHEIDDIISVVNNNNFPNF